jgi:hypothetical protein
LSFKKSGLMPYRKYLTEQHEFASKSDSRNAYKKYIEEQIELSKRKFKEIDENLN